MRHLRELLGVFLGFENSNRPRREPRKVVGDNGGENLQPAKGPPRHHDYTSFDSFEETRHSPIRDPRPKEDSPAHLHPKHLRIKRLTAIGKKGWFKASAVPDWRLSVCRKNGVIDTRLPKVAWKAPRRPRVRNNGDGSYGEKGRQPLNKEKPRAGSQPPFEKKKKKKKARRDPGLAERMKKTSVDDPLVRRPHSATAAWASGVDDSRAVGTEG